MKIVLRNTYNYTDDYGLRDNKKRFPGLIFSCKMYFPKFIEHDAGDKLKFNETS